MARLSTSRAARLRGGVSGCGYPQKSTAMTSIAAEFMAASSVANQSGFMYDSSGAPATFGSTRFRYGARASYQSVWGAGWMVSASVPLGLTMCSWRGNLGFAQLYHEKKYAMTIRSPLANDRRGG